MVLFSVCLFTVLPKTSLVNKDLFYHLVVLKDNPNICLCQEENEENEVVKSIFCRVLDNVFKRKRILYM